MLTFDSVSQASFQGTCVPCSSIPAPVSSKYMQISKKWLRLQPSFFKSKRDCLRKFLEWLMRTRTAHNKSKVVLVSHGNFRSDKVVLESECLRQGFRLPDCVYFFDTLPMFRLVLPRIETYSLSAISKTILHTTRAPEHRALADTHLLERCLRVVGPRNIVGCFYRAYNVPLQSLPGVGSRIERHLVLLHGVKGTYDLAARCVALRAVTRRTCRSLLVTLYGLNWRSAKIITRSLLPMLYVVPSGSTGVVCKHYIGSST